MVGTSSDRARPQPETGMYIGPAVRSSQSPRPALLRRLFAAPPAREPLGQRAGVTEVRETVVDGVMVAPHDVVQKAVRHLRFDVGTIQPLVALHIEAVMQC